MYQPRSVSFGLLRKSSSGRIQPGVTYCQFRTGPVMMTENSPALLREIGDQLGEVFRLGQDQVLDIDARQLAELGDQRQQRFGERVLVQADGERLALGLLPVDLGLAVVGQRLVILRRAREACHREGRRKEQSCELSAPQAHLCPPILSKLVPARFFARGLYPVKQNRIP